MNACIGSRPAYHMNYACIVRIVVHISDTALNLNTTVIVIDNSQYTLAAEYASSAIQDQKPEGPVPRHH